MAYADAAKYHGHDAHAHHPAGIMRWVQTTNHKDIGTLYLIFSLTMFFIGGLLAFGIRAELFQPGLQFWRPEFFNELTTMHGLIMVFGAIMPAFVGFANWQIPMMIGAPDMAFARMNNWSFWLLPGAAILLVTSVFAPGCAAVRSDLAGGLVLRSGRRGRGRLDDLRAAVDADGPGHGHGHLRAAHHGR